MNRQIGVLCMCVALLGFPILSRAAIDCTNTVKVALLYSDGSVNIFGSWRNDYTVICNVRGEWGSVPAEVCLSWYATAVKAASEGKMLTLHYATTSYTCANLPTYSNSLVPLYVGIAVP